MTKSGTGAFGFFGYEWFKSKYPNVMQIKSILTQDRTRAKWNSTSKKKLLEQLSYLFAQYCEGIDADELFTNLVEREKLGSTGIGEGIAIPHCRCNTGGATLGACITLDEPIDFDSADSRPVDLLFAMLVPENAEAEHLETLANVAEAMQKAELVKDLREASSDEQLFQLITQTSH